MPRAVGRNRAKHLPPNQPSLGPGGAGSRKSLARGGRASVRRRTRRFGHFALKPGKVFAPRRTTRRQCRAWFGWHRAAGREKQGGAPPCLAVGLFVRAALGAGKFCAKWPRSCPPPHAAFRTLCPQAGQSVRSEAHYAAAVPRLVRPALGGRPSKTGRSAALPCRAALSAPFFRPHFPGLPRLRPADPRGPLRAPRAKTGKIRLFCDISAFVNRICF